MDAPIGKRFLACVMRAVRADPFTLSAASSEEAACWYTAIDCSRSFCVSSSGRRSGCPEINVAPGIFWTFVWANPASFTVARNTARERESKGCPGLAFEALWVSSGNGVREYWNRWLTACTALSIWEPNRFTMDDTLYFLVAAYC